MRVSKTTDYALRVMVALALANGERLNLQLLSSREKIPRKFLEHIVRLLRDAGLVNSTPGPKGGYRLNRPPETISVAQIIQAVQGPIHPSIQFDFNDHPDHLREPIKRLENVMNDIRAFTRHRLESITLADLAEVSELGGAEVLMYYI